MAVILSSRFKKIIVDVVCLLYILLFVYAAVSKILDFENFKAEIAQSPLLSAFAGWVPWTVLVSELVIAILLLFPKMRLKALYAGFLLMSMFTCYIYVILNYSEFIPCSCGGVLEKMSWQTHMLFNLCFVFLAAYALWLKRRKTGKKINIDFSSLKFLFITFSAGCGAVILLFLFSEKIIHHSNPFIRRYPHHPVKLQHIVDLQFNSYYFAGTGSETVYLGNSTVPLYILAIDSMLNEKKIRVSFNKEKFLFKANRLAVRPPYFYILDGRGPSIFRGRIADWKAELIDFRPPFFNIAEPLDSSTIVFRGISRINKNNIIGVFDFSANKVDIANDLLQKQIDGVLDTDGMLHYSGEIERIVYLYSYRNQYVLAKRDGTVDYRGNTIDTISHAQIKVAYLRDKTERTMGAPPLTVNKSSSVFGHLLFVNSNVPGRYEQNRVWEQSSIIDVYDIKKRIYLFSFPVYGIKGKKLRNFVVTSTHLYALIDTKLVVYQLNEILRKEFK